MVRLTSYVDTKTYDMISQAARLEDRSVSRFILLAGRDRAINIFRQCGVKLNQEED